MLNFHPEKSKYMRIRTEKDIGVVINGKLSLSEHITEKVNKANRIFGVIRYLLASYRSF